VAPNGNDAHPGTEAQPWKTLQKAARSVEPGDTVRIKAGDYAVRPSWTVNRAGTAERPITYQSYGDGEVRINPSSVIPPGTWTRVRDAIHSTQVAQRPAYVFQNSYPLHSPGDRVKIYSVDDMIPNSFFGEGKRGGISLNSVNNLVYHNTFVDSSYAIEFHSRLQNYACGVASLFTSDVVIHVPVSGQQIEHGDRTGQVVSRTSRPILPSNS
jgi:hypothetical protein